MANEYCRYLSNGFRFLGADLTYQPCCWVPASNPIYSADQLNQVRIDTTKKVLANKEQYCHDCINRESRGFNTSIRNHSFKCIPEDAEDGEIIDLSIQIDTTCNAACVMCGPHFSSLWQKEANPKAILFDASDKYKNLIDILDLSKVKYLRFFGGEPLVNDNHLIMLNAIQHPEQVNLLYFTNGSIFPNQETIQAWNKFNKVFIKISIDAIDDRFHYIRWPLKWNKVENNVYEICKLDCVASVIITSTINPMNILYFDELESWFTNLKTKFLKVNTLDTSICYGTWGLDAIPQQLREQVIKKYGNDHRIAKMLDSILTVDSTKWNKLVAEMLRLDLQRNLSYTEIFPEVISIVNNI